ncbi:delta and Notch-like epidermal growth factor-related receptor [Dysidea avara]|uniref:delta and Notch-like epidermal growth factor-related receptor n=1 Tax=Dysidea avara TaxID=196820 RepID=UPI003320ACE9
MSMRYDGSNLTVVLGPQHVYMPQCLAVFEDEVFYCETVSHQLYHANKFGRSIPHQLEGNSSALTLVHPLLQPEKDPYERQLSQPCSGNPCGTGLCLPANSTFHRCMCPDGYKVDHTRGCIKDPYHREPCGPGVCLPAGDGYSCDCPHGYQSEGSHCNALQQSVERAQSKAIIASISVVILILFVVAVISIIMGYRYYYRTRQLSSDERKLEPRDSEETVSYTENRSGQSSPDDNAQHHRISTQF